MDLFKSTLMSFIFLFSIGVCATNNSAKSESEYNKLVLDLSVELLEDCYYHKHKTGVMLAQCISDAIKGLPDPYHYKLLITGDMPGNVSLEIYNEEGFMIKCYLTVYEKITVNHCVKKQINPLTKEQDISIIPPAQIDD